MTAQQQYDNYRVTHETNQAEIRPDMESNYGHQVVIIPIDEGD